MARHTTVGPTAIRVWPAVFVCGDERRGDSISTIPPPHLNLASILAQRTPPQPPNMASPDPEPAQVLFRPGKKRKIYRYRSAEDEGANTKNDEASTNSVAAVSTTINDSSVAITRGNANEDGLSVAEVLRLRNARKHRHGGVAFRAGPITHGGDGSATNENPEQSMVLHDSTGPPQQEDPAILAGINKRFAPQTGLAGELVNKHM